MTSLFRLVFRVHPSVPSCDSLIFILLEGIVHLTEVLGAGVFYFSCFVILPNLWNLPGFLLCAICFQCYATHSHSRLGAVTHLLPCFHPVKEKTSAGVVGHLERLLIFKFIFFLSFALRWDETFLVLCMMKNYCLEGINCSSAFIL